MTCTSRFMYSNKYKVNIDLTDGYTIDVSRNPDPEKIHKNYGKQLTFVRLQGGYLYCHKINKYMHQLVCDACCYNPRPKLFTVIDHKNGILSDNSPHNLDCVNRHINNNNRHWYPNKHELPPGLQFCRSYKGKKAFYSFRKCGCTVKTFNLKQKQVAIDWTLDFITKYRNALKNVYVTAPDPEDEPDKWRAHIRKHFIRRNEFNKDRDKEDVLALRRFPVTEEKYLKLTGTQIEYL